MISQRFFRHFLKRFRARKGGVHHRSIAFRGQKLLPRSSFSAGAVRLVVETATTTKRRRHFWFFAFRIVPVASVFACVFCAQYSSTKWRSTRSNSIERREFCPGRKTRGADDGARGDEDATTDRKFEKERDAQRSRLKEKNAEINQLKEEVKKSKPTASAKMAMEAKKRTKN